MTQRARFRSRLPVPSTRSKAQGNVGWRQAPTLLMAFPMFLAGGLMGAALVETWSVPSRHSSPCDQSFLSGALPARIDAARQAPVGSALQLHRASGVAPEGGQEMTAQLSAGYLLTSFAAGIVSFLSPCVLPLVPGYISYVGGQSFGGQPPVAAIGARLAALRLSLFFVLGFSTVFIALGASATALGQLLLSYRYEANLAGGAAVILFGLFMIGVFRLQWLQRDVRFHLPLPGGRPVAAYVLGLAFAFGWTPCIGPVLGAILTTSAVSATVQQGIALLAIYSLGLGLPFLAAALFTDWLLRRLRFLGRLGRSLQIGAGAALVAMGAAMMTGELNAFSYWLLDVFPALAKIG